MARSTVPLFKKSLPDLMRTRLSESQRFLILCLLCGLICGTVSVGFHLGIEFLFESLITKAQTFGPVYFAPVMIAAPTLAGLLAGLAIHFFAPSAVGGGITQTRQAYFNQSGEVPLAAGVWRFLIGIVYLGMGNSLGREGPIAHISASISSAIGRWGFRDRQRARAMLPVGMAAGVAAAFNAPLAAITFVYEQLLDNFSMRALGSIVIAVVVAAALSRGLLGDAPILAGHLDVRFKLSLWMLVAIPLGLLTGIAGHLIISSILLTRRAFRANRRLLPPWVQPAIGGLLCGLLGVSAIYLTGLVQEDVPEGARASVFSIGYEALQPAFSYQLVWQVLAILFVFKLVAVVVSFASGGSGGMFSPSLFLGGMLGGLTGIGVVWLHQEVFPIPGLPDAAHVVGGCVLLGMGAAFAAIIRCPFTSLVIIFEMTGNYSLILPLMAGNIIAWAVSRKFGPVDVYNAILLQDGVTLKHMPSYRGPQDYRNLPVSAIMTHDVVTVGASERAAHARSRLKEANAEFRTYPVVADDGSLVGLLSREDLVGALADADLGGLVVGQQLVVAHPDTSIRDIANRMVARDIHQVPIISAKESGKLLGFVTLNDIARQRFAEEND